MAHIPIKRYGNLTPQALQVIFTSSQTYTIPSKYKNMDVFLVGGGGGAAGTYEYHGSYYNRIAPGGAGSGYTTTQKLIDINNNELTITVGAGGNGGSCFYKDSGGMTRGDIRPTDGSPSNIIVNGNTITANGGKLSGGSTYSRDGKKGGSGGGSTCLVYQTARSYVVGAGGSNGGNGGEAGTYDKNGNYAKRTDGGTGQGTTTRAFEEGTGTLYAGGGGVGATADTWHNTSTERTDYLPSSAGGAGGGGNGSSGYGGNGWANTGGGGGSGGYNVNSFTTKVGGAGGSGIAIIRLYKDSNRPIVDWSKCTISL